MDDDNAIYEKLINMWDKREYMLELLSQNKARPLHLEAQSNAADIVTKIYNETGGDRERTLHLFEKALENYNKDAIHYGDIASEVANFRSSNGKWSEKNS